MVGCDDAGVRLASLSVAWWTRKKMVWVRLPNLNISGSFRTVALNRLIGTLDWRSPSDHPEMVRDSDFTPPGEPLSYQILNMQWRKLPPSAGQRE